MQTKTKKEAIAERITELQDDVAVCNLHLDNSRHPDVRQAFINLKKLLQQAIRELSEAYHATND